MSEVPLYLGLKVGLHRPGALVDFAGSEHCPGPHFEEELPGVLLSCEEVRVEGNLHKSPIDIDYYKSFQSHY